MKILNQLKIVLLFSGAAEQKAQQYVKSFSSFENEFCVEPIKSLRFDNNLADFRTLATASSSTIQGEVGELGQITVTQYGIHDEEPERYAFYNEAYDNLFIKFIPTKQRYNKFLKNNRVCIKRTVEFQGALIAEYTTANSDRLRYAVYCAHDSEFSEQDLQEFANRCNANKTAVFG